MGYSLMGAIHRIAGNRTVRRMLVSQFTQGLGHCRAPFDPGAVIDDEGTGWLSFGGGGKGEVGTDYMPEDARIVRLGKDLISLDSEIVEIKAPYRT